MVTPNKTIPDRGWIFQNFKTIFSPHMHYVLIHEECCLVDQERVHKLATPLGIEPRISSFIRGSNLNLIWVYWSTWFIDQWTFGPFG